MSVVVVDWLGRGGITQTTRTWLAVCEAHGHATTVVTRGDRELRGDAVRAPAEGPHPLLTHRRLAELAARAIEELRPDLVIVQNYVVPAIERPLDRASAGYGSRTIIVMHDHQHHSRLAGNRAGLDRRLRAADVIVTHSAFVAERVSASTGRDDVSVVPLPAPHVGESGVNRLPPGECRTAIGFGVMKRSYKGAGVIRSLAGSGVPGWRFAIAGVGAPASTPEVLSFPGYLDARDLVATVAGADSALMPYRLATQSGAIPFAQAVGTVPIATAVGGIAEQIDSGRDGVLVPPGAGFSAWREALDLVASDGPMLSTNGRRRVACLDAEFRHWTGALV